MYSHDHYTYTYTCRNIFNTIRTSEDSSLEKYTSHFIWKGPKGLLKILLCERWVGDWTELQHIDPQSYGHNSVSFPFSWATQPGAWGSSLSAIWSSFQHLLSNCNCSIRGLRAPSAGCWFSLPHLISNSLCIELYYCFAPTQFSLSTAKVIPLTPSTGCTSYLHRCISYFDSSPGVNMQQSFNCHHHS